jgi:hypothetical protein
MLQDLCQWAREGNFHELEKRKNYVEIVTAVDTQGDIMYYAATCPNHVRGHKIMRFLWEQCNYPVKLWYHTLAGAIVSKNFYILEYLEHRMSHMDEFWECALIIIRTLGLDIYDPVYEWFLLE